MRTLLLALIVLAFPCTVVSQTTNHDSALAIQGIVVSSFGQTNYEGPNLPIVLNSAVNDGASYVSIGSASVIDVSTGIVSDLLFGTGDATINFADMGPAIAAAKAKGLNVMLKPYMSTNSSTYAGALVNPDLVIPNPPAFFAGYKEYILKWAQLAQQYNVSILSIGSEMYASTLPKYTPYWEDIIISIRQAYRGKLTYGALDPDNGNEVSKIQFWNKLDYVGIDVYPKLTDQDTPTVTTLNAAWQQDEQAIQQIAASLNMPVLFTETGVASFSGAAEGPATDGLQFQPGTVSNYILQANWFESFFETWVSNKPSWLSGVFFLAADPGQLGSAQHADTGYNISGKPAELIVSSWFGGKDYLGSMDSSFIGSIADDQIYLDGDKFTVAIQNAKGTRVTQQQTFETIVSFTVSGPIINGKTPTVHAHINGIDEGTETLKSAPNGYVDPQGAPWTGQMFAYVLPQIGLSDISELRLEMGSEVNVGGIENPSILIDPVSINGVNLTQSVYHPLSGPAQQQALPIRISDGGYSLLDLAPWERELASRTIGTAANPIRVDGGGGSDTVHVLGTRGQYAISGFGTGTISLSENSGLNQNAILTNIAQLVFQDGTALSLNTQVNLGGYLSGNWFDASPNQSGHGFQLEFTGQGNTVVAIWFVYAPNGGGQNWIYAQGTFDSTKNSVTIPAFLLTGPRFPPFYNSNDLQKIDWGTLTFTFSDCNNGTASWNSTLAGYGGGTIPIQRLTSIQGTSVTCAGGTALSDQPSWSATYNSSGEKDALGRIPAQLAVTGDALSNTGHSRQGDQKNALPPQIVSLSSSNSSINLGGYMSGNWFDASPNQSGHGFQLEFTGQANTVVAIWFVYAPNGGGQNWVYAQGTFDSTKNSVTTPAFLLTGPKFPPLYNSRDLKQNDWGTLTFTFNDCNNGTASWNSTVTGYGSGAIPIQRLTSIQGTTCPP